MRHVIIFFIKMYQKTLSPDHGPLRVFNQNGACKYHPSCSQYGIDSLKKHGTTKALPKIAYRVLRCNPWSDGGNDPA